MAKDNKQEDNSIPKMELDNKYSPKKPSIEDMGKAQKEAEKTKKEIEKLKSFIIKKFPYVEAISVLPPQAIPLFIEEEEVPKETEKQIHLNLIIPE